MEQWKTRKEQRLDQEAAESEEEENIYAVEDDVSFVSLFLVKLDYVLMFQSDDDNDDGKQQIDGSQQRFTAHVPVPSQQEVEQALLKKRKQELMEKYGVQGE